MTDFIIRNDVPMPAVESRPSKSCFPWETLTSGQAFFIPVTRDTVARKRSSMRHMAKRAGKRWKREFEVRSLTLDGLSQQYVGVWMIDAEVSE